MNQTSEHELGVPGAPGVDFETWQDSTSPTRRALGFHQVHEDIVDAGEVAFAFGLQPFQHLRVEADADRDLLRTSRSSTMRKIKSGPSTPSAEANSAQDDIPKKGFRVTNCGHILLQMQ